jgi:bifunctional DNase/RNase
MKKYIKIGLAVVLLSSLVFVSVGKEKTAFIEMVVKGVSLDAMGHTPVVVLTDKEEKKALPIWIGPLEANAIDKELKHITSARPMTHDLFYSILGQVHVKVKEIKIVELKNQTYYATLSLILNKELIEVDARPSDAIILALKSKSPIFVSIKILDEQGIAFNKKEGLGERYGIRIQELTPSLASHFNFKGQKGVLVSEVISGSTSEASGIKAGDIITKINLKEVGNIREFEDILDAAKELGSHRILLFRDEKFQEVNLILKP